MKTDLRRLERLYKTYHSDRFLATDPLGIVRSYTDAEDREVVGLLAAVLAHGQVAPMRSNITRLVAPLGEHPARSLRRLPEKSLRAPRGWTHRFATSRDATALLRALARMLRRWGSLRLAFADGHGPAAETVRPGLDRFVEKIRASCELVAGRPWERMPYGLQHLLPHPAMGSACKRWNLYLRWMGRGGGGDVDPGDWRPLLAPRQLIVPLDVHVGRAARAMGWTRRRAPSWAMAEEVTAALRALDPDDPLRYDFALTRPGILRRSGAPGARETAGRSRNGTGRAERNGTRRLKA